MAVLNVLASQAAMSLEKTRLYRELQEREAKIRRLVDANIIGIITYDLDGRILEANDAFLRMVGYDRQELVLGQPALDGPDAAGMAGARRTMGGAGARAVGRPAPVREGVFPARTAAACPSSSASRASKVTRAEVCAFVLDLTERKRAEDAQKRAEGGSPAGANSLSRIVSVVSLLGEVAASLAHEIKQPIAAATIDAQVCLRALGDGHLNLHAAGQAASRMLKDAMWAEEIIKRTTARCRNVDARRKLRAREHQCGRSGNDPLAAAGGQRGLRLDFDGDRGAHPGHHGGPHPAAAGAS